MITNPAIIQDMLDILRDSITNASISTPNKKKIFFYDASDVELVAIEFDDMQAVAAGDGKSYEFITSSGSNQLSAEISNSGTVFKFKIFGYDGGDIDAIDGTVGVSGSSADIKFNSTVWIAGQLVDLSNVTIKFEQGV